MWWPWWIPIALGIILFLLIIVAGVVSKRKAVRAAGQNPQPNPAPPQQGGGAPAGGGNQPPNPTTSRGERVREGAKETWVIALAAFILVPLIIWLLFPTVAEPVVTGLDTSRKVGIVLAISFIGYLLWATSRPQAQAAGQAQGAARQAAPAASPRPFKWLIWLVTVLLALGLLVQFTNSQEYKDWAKQSQARAKAAAAKASAKFETDPKPEIGSKKVIAPLKPIDGGDNWSEQVVIPGSPQSIVFRNEFPEIDEDVEVMNLKGDRMVFRKGPITTNEETERFIHGSGLVNRALKFQSLGETEVPLIVEWK